MGLTCNSCKRSAFCDVITVNKNYPDEIVVALAGNPNTGKSTVFNALTGLKQHTGNWPGKTVVNAQGNYTYREKKFIMVDLPGTYSLLANSVEEQVARDFICFDNPMVTVVVTDATCLERNLNLVLQVLEITDKVVVCVNLMDEARKKGIRIDINGLSKMLGVPVVGTSARSNEGLDELMKMVYAVVTGQIKTEPYKIIYDEKIESAIQAIEPKLKEILGERLNARWVALRLIDGDMSILESMNQYLNIQFDDTMKGSVKNESINNAYSTS